MSDKNEKMSDRNARFAADLSDPRHGTPNGYNNLKCRCADCRKAWAASVMEAKIRRSKRPIPEHVHGTENGYGNYSCRCEPCTKAWAVGTLARNHRRTARNSGVLT